MATFTAFQLKELDNLLNSSGYTPLIANSNSEFYAFFKRLNISIYNDYGAGSKGKTLMNFWQKSSNAEALNVINEVEMIIDYNLNDDLALQKIKKLFISIKKSLSIVEIIKIDDTVSVNKNYKIVSELNPGGFGDTFLIEDTELQQQFVMKRFRGGFLERKQEEVFLEKFRLEIKLLYQLSHQNIVKIYDYCYDKKAWYIMEHIAGVSLDKYIEKTPDAINKIFSQMINVFCYLELKGMCHRDIRPSNILVDNDSLVKLIDFGFAKIIEGNGTLKEGTPFVNYPQPLPEEMLNSNPSYDNKTEIYFLGRLFEKLINDNKIEDFIYKKILNKMIVYKKEERAQSFLNIRNEIFKGLSSKKDNENKDIRHNYIKLEECIKNIIAIMPLAYQSYGVDEIIKNLISLKNNYTYSEKIDDNKELLLCFVNEYASYYSQREKITLEYIEEIINWLSKMDQKEKENVSNSLIRLFKNIEKTDDLPFY